MRSSAAHMSGHNGTDRRGVQVAGSWTWAAALALLSRPQRKAHSNLSVKRAFIPSSRSRVQVCCSSPGSGNAVFVCGGRPSSLPLPVMAMRRPRRRGVDSRGSDHTTPAGGQLARNEPCRGCTCAIENASYGLSTFASLSARTRSRRESGEPRSRSRRRRSSSRRSIAWLRKQSGGLQRAREQLRPVRTRRASNAQLVGGALPALQSLPKRAQEASAEAIVETYELRARVSRLLVTRFG